MDRRLFIQGVGAGIAGLSFPVTALPARLQQSAIAGKSLWSGSNGRTAGSCTVIGIGGAGCNIVRAVWSSAVLDSATLPPDYICVDLGQQALRYIAAASANHPEHAPIMTIALAPVGAGGWVNGARVVALRQREVLRALVADADMVVLVAGLGGGTGSGVAPIMARLAREAKIPTVVVVAITPFEYETVRQRKAPATIKKLEHDADQVLIVSNEELSEDCDNVPMADAFTILDCRIGERIRDLVDRGGDGFCRAQRGV